MNYKSPRTELDEAKQSGDVSRLHAILESYPDAGLGAEVQKAVDALYAAAMQRYRAKASQEHPEMTEFVESLAAVFAKSGENVLQVRFTHKISEEMQEASANSAGALKELVGERATARESRLVAVLAKAIGFLFPRNGVTLVMVQAVDITVPALEIAYFGGMARFWLQGVFKVVAKNPDPAFTAEATFFAKSSTSHDEGDEVTVNELFVDATNGLLSLFLARLSPAAVRAKKGVDHLYFDVNHPPRQEEKPLYLASEPSSNTTEVGAFNGLAAGTIVLTAAEKKDIGAVRAGEWVACRNQSTGEGEWRLVIGVMRGKSDKVIQMGISNGFTEWIAATPELLFFVANQGWRAAKDLAVGDKLVCDGKEALAIVEIEQLLESTEIYNIEVEGLHNYFVGEEVLVWIHD